VNAVAPPVRLPRLDVGLQRVRMQYDVVGDHQRARLELLARELEQLLVHLVGGVEEDHVEDVVDYRQRLACVALDNLRRFFEPGLRDVAVPGTDALVVALQGEDAAT